MDFLRDSFLLLIYSLNFLLSGSTNPKTSASVDRCKICSTIADKFLEGISRTSKSNFGGGNTRWEEENLGKYVFSETRFIEIAENICIGEAQECHQMLEAHEELLELWWKKYYAQRVESDLREFLCVRRLKVCCSKGTYGPSCKDCSGGRKNPCNGNGRCDGDGTKDGTGECKCDVGYEGQLCQECSDGFYDNNPEGERSQGDPNPLSYKPTCIPCHSACRMSCKGKGPESCQACKDGWVMIDGVGCSDLNECEDVSMCAAGEFCTNTEGSYKCAACNEACGTCTGAEIKDCITCNTRYYRDRNGTCTACHESCAKSCSDETPRSCDQCRRGWKADQGGVCQDVNECQSSDIIQLRCSSDEYCVNTVGSYKCSTCHPTCEGCHGAGNNKCTKCKEGYQKDKEESCVDVDECQKPEEACPGSNKRCINLPGGYRCDCESGFKMQGGLCVHSSKAGSSDAERGTSPSYPSPSNQRKSSNEAKKVKKKKVPLYKRDLPQYAMRLAGFTVVCSLTKRKLFVQTAITAAFAGYLYYYAGELDGSYAKA